MALADHVIVHVEIKQKDESSLNEGEIEKQVRNFLSTKSEIYQGALYAGEILREHVDYIRLYFNSDDEYAVRLNQVQLDLRCYVYQTFSVFPQYDTIDEGTDDSPVACLGWSLPNSQFEGLWESLIISESIKNQLLSYVQTALLYAVNHVSKRIIGWNGVVLLHGPPGAGKTSLCKALAQKLSIRLSNRYKSGHFIEINSHSLFSKWYSESPKLVFKMFQTVKHWLEFEDNFVCILMDEVESLIHSRQSSGSEPADSIRVVNTVLTQLDHLQSYQNFVILATSNVTDCIDVAFADRADFKLYIGYPDKWGAYEILRSGIEELIRCRLINDCSTLIETHLLKNNCTIHNTQIVAPDSNTLDLIDLSNFCEGLSGRTLRKIPFLTSTKFIDKPLPNVSEFLAAMRCIVKDHKSDNEKYFKSKSCV